MIDPKLSVENQIDSRNIGSAETLLFAGAYGFKRDLSSTREVTNLEDVRCMQPQLSKPAMMADQTFHTKSLQTAHVRCKNLALTHTASYSTHEDPFVEVRL